MHFSAVAVAMACNDTEPSLEPAKAKQSLPCPMKSWYASGDGDTSETAWLTAVLKREREIESRKLGLLWKSLHGAPLLRQILNDQEPHEWPTLAAPFQANFHVKFWDLVRHLEKNDASMDHSATSSSQDEARDDRETLDVQSDIQGMLAEYTALDQPEEPVSEASPINHLQQQEMAKSEFLEDDPQVEVEVLNSDDDIFYA